MTNPETADEREQTEPHTLKRLWRGTFWLALKSPLQVIIALWSVPLVQSTIGPEANGAYVFAWGFGFIQLLLEFGMGTALQRQMTLTWSAGDRRGVNRLIIAGLMFYAIATILQIILLLAIAYWGLPSKFQGDLRRLIIGLLWIQALSAPFFGLLSIGSCVLQAATRYDIVPRLDLATMILRFLILVFGLWAQIPFLLIIAAQMFLVFAGLLVPTFWIMINELGGIPKFVRPSRHDYAELFRVGFYIFLMQVSVVLADKIDTTILGYALPTDDPGPSITVYQNVSRPFFQIRQAGWTLAYLVIPAVARLTAVHDSKGLERLKYDGTRFLIALLFPVGLLAAIYARPFLHLWVGSKYVPYAPLLQLFLIAALPLALSVPSQMAIGMGRIEVVAISPLVGSLVNLPLSYYLTTRIGVAGVIWGTVLTTLVSNLLIPGAYLYQLLEFRLSIVLVRIIAAPFAGATALALTAWLMNAILPADPAGQAVQIRTLTLIVHLVLGTIAYAVGYFAAPWGRLDLALCINQIKTRTSLF
jgi:O-antigen/teichoic acid export membrane protein